MEKSQELIREIQKGLLQWYDLKEGSLIFYVGEEKEPLAEMLVEKGAKLVYGSCQFAKHAGWWQQHRKYFDYIVCIEKLETDDAPLLVLEGFCRTIKDDGKLLLGMNNRLGLRFFCGDRDPYTNRCFDGVEGYKRAYAKKEDNFQGAVLPYGGDKRNAKAVRMDSKLFLLGFSGIEKSILALCGGYDSQ